MHDMDDQPFEIDERAPCTPCDICELRAGQRDASSVQAWDKKNGGIEIKPLCQRRGCDSNGQDAFGQKPFNLAEERIRKPRMMNCHANIKTLNGGMFWTEPFTSNCFGAVDGRNVTKERRKEAAAREIDDSSRISFNVISLRAEYERPLPFFSELPGRSQR